MSEYIATFAILVVPVLLAVTLHEVAHGWAAYKCGDPTAKMAGRLTLNPLKHLDLVGTLVFFITRMVGWAKPVPVNPHNFRRPRQDMVWVAAAGPLANILLAAAFAVLFRLLAAGVDVIPFALLKPLILTAQYGVIINIGLAVFNVLPIPPLDGSNILAGLLPLELAVKYERLTPYGFVILLILIFTNLVDKIIFPIINFLSQLFLGVM